MIRAFTKQIIWITGILQIVFGIGTAIVYVGLRKLLGIVQVLTLTVCSPLLQRSYCIPDIRHILHHLLHLMDTTHPILCSNAPDCY